MTFQKHRFSLSKTCVFEVGAPPEHQKNESESDVKNKLDFRAFLDNFWSEKGLILEPFLSHFGVVLAPFWLHFGDKFWLFFRESFWIDF